MVSGANRPWRSLHLGIEPILRREVTISYATIHSTIRAGTSGFGLGFRPFCFRVEVTGSFTTPSQKSNEEIIVSHCILPCKQKIFVRADSTSRTQAGRHAGYSYTEWPRRTKLGALRLD